METNAFITARITEHKELLFLVEMKICRVGTLVVSEKHQRSGIGISLMAAVEAWAKKLGAREVRLEVMKFNRKAAEFYEAIGYKKTLPNTRKKSCLVSCYVNEGPINE